MSIEDEAKERGLHLHLCTEADNALTRARDSMWKVESERRKRYGKRYGRYDPIATKAYEVRMAMNQAFTKTAEVSRMLSIEQDRGLRNEKKGRR